MKKLLTLTAMVIALVFTNDMYAQEFSGLDKSPADIASYPSSGREPAKKVRVIYSRPQLKGRSLAELAPAGKVWRTGANEASEITFYEDARVGDTNVEAGTYALFTIPGNDTWTVILNNNLNQWGSFSYDEAADAARISAKATETSESLEAFSIAFKEVEGGVQMIMGWGSSRVTVPISFTM
jgi:hypothetical protein